MVIQLFRREWAARPQARWGAHAVAMHFALPGVMSLLTLADPGGVLLWRVSFAAFAALGAFGVVLLGRAGGAASLPQVLHWGAGILYAAVTLVALFANLVAGAFGATPLTVEAILLSLLVFLGLNIALALLLGGAGTDGGT